MFKKVLETAPFFLGGPFQFDFAYVLQIYHVFSSFCFCYRPLYQNLPYRLIRATIIPILGLIAK